MISLEIPDPFTTTKTKQYSFTPGYSYDYFAQEWSYTCLTCNDMLSGPNKYELLKIQLYHTRNECLGGW